MSRARARGLDLPIQAEVGIGNGHSHSVASVVLPAGTGYEAGSELATTLLTTPQAETRHVVDDLVADISFTPVGTSSDAQIGTAASTSRSTPSATAPLGHCR